MGFDTQARSENKFLNINQTELVATEAKSDAGDTLRKGTVPSKASSEASLDAILNDIESSMEEWPKEALRNALQRFGRMPRLGWSRAHNTFCGKFNVSISLEGFKKRASSVLVTQTGKRCTNREFKKDSAKRVKSVGTVLEENTLHEAKVCNEVRKIYLDCLEQVKEADVDKVERTRKIPNERINHLMLEAVAKAVGEYLRTTTPKSMAEIAKIIQAAQLCYQRASTKQYKPSVWRVSIERKIDTINSLINLLERSNKLERLNKDEKSKLKTLMSQENLRFGNARDGTEAITRLGERVVVYQKKIEMHEKRKEFSRENQSFELYRRRFYRGLTGDSTASHDVPASNIKEFWSTMWNKNPDEVEHAKLDEFLHEYVPGIEPENMFPSFE